MRAVIYTRVSSDTSGRGRSVSEQEAECRQLCEREDWEVAQVLTDNDTGASRWSRKSRPAYRELERALQSGDVLVTWEASRAQRDLKAYVELRDLCAERNVMWSYSGRTYDLSRGDDRFTTGLDALLSEKEAEQTRERVLRGVRANAAAGKPHGKLPYGYRIVRDPNTGESIERVPDETTAPIFRDIARRVMAGESLYSIVNDLNARGVPAPRPGRDGQQVKWIPTVTGRMVMSPTYAGLRVHKGVVIGPATWPALISMEDHERLKAIITDPRRLTHQGSDPKWLLSGVATCGECDGPMRRAKNRGFDNYICGRKFCVARSIKHADHLVAEAVLERLEKSDALELLNDSDDSTREAIEEARALRQRLDSFTDQAADGGLSAGALARVEAKLLPQIAAAEARARAGQRSPLIAGLSGEHARERWDALPVSERKQVVKSFVQVRFLRTGKSKMFNPNSVELTWL